MLPHPSTLSSDKFEFCGNSLSYYKSSIYFEPKKRRNNIKNYARSTTELLSNHFWFRVMSIFIVNLIKLM
jgi:hypothetical protein